MIARVRRCRMRAGRVCVTEESWRSPVEPLPFVAGLPGGCLFEPELGEQITAIVNRIEAFHCFA